MISDNNKAIYLQIADRICDDILEGKYEPGGRLPSVRDCASSMEVNANTVMRFYDHLASMGIIANLRGIGYFVDVNDTDTVKALGSRHLLEDEPLDVL